MTEEKMLDFGDYCLIEQHRFVGDNEMYLHKIIGRLNSNTYVDVPVVSIAKETHHGEIVPVIACVCCGVAERQILKYRAIDCKPNIATKNHIHDR